MFSARVESIKDLFNYFKFISSLLNVAETEALSIIFLAVLSENQATSTLKTIIIVRATALDIFLSRYIFIFIFAIFI